MNTSEFTTKDIERFWSKVVKSDDPDSCWEWQAGKDKDGYGKIKIAQKNFRSHRVAWIITNEDIPNDLNVLHKCDNPPCCNPHHLFLGTTLDNNRDKVRKHRQYDQRGENAPLAKLTWKQVREIRAIYAQGNVSQYQLAKSFDAHPMSISLIVRNKIWIE